MVRLEEAVDGVEPVPIYRGTEELGATVSIVGRGVTATGLVGEDGASSDHRPVLARRGVADLDATRFDLLVAERIRCEVGDDEAGDGVDVGIRKLVGVRPGASATNEGRNAATIRRIARRYTS